MQIHQHGHQFLISCFTGLINELKSFNEVTTRVQLLESMFARNKSVTNNLRKENGRLNNEIANLWMQ